jgi:hypothetical protein
MTPSEMNQRLFRFWRNKEACRLLAQQPEPRYFFGRTSSFFFYRSGEACCPWVRPASALSFPLREMANFLRNRVWGTLELVASGTCPCCPTSRTWPAHCCQLIHQAGMVQTLAAHQLTPLSLSWGCRTCQVFLKLTFHPFRYYTTPASSSPLQ